jgi:hypothetical protein
MDSCCVPGCSERFWLTTWFVIIVKVTTAGENPCSSTVRS